jgi:hypothetical protein
LFQLYSKDTRRPAAVLVAKEHVEMLTYIKDWDQAARKE